MSKPTLILLHGALGSERQFDALKTRLENTFDVHTLTFEGHGGVPLSGPFGIATFAQNVADYMDKHQLESASFFGYSMGGYVALTLASTHPEKVEKVITYGTKFVWTPEFASGEVRKLNPEKIEEKVPQFANHLAQVHAPLDWKKVVSDTAEMMVDLGNHPLLTETIFTSIAQPTLVLLGELDNMSTVEESKAIAALLPYGEFEVMVGFEHQIEKVDLEVLVGRIGEFSQSDSKSIIL
jgi:pimeloyl-ACP methyl ester carboxylesterase